VCHFLPSWIRNRILNPDPDTDPLTWLNPDAIRNRTRIQNTEKHLRSLLQLLLKVWNSVSDAVLLIICSQCDTVVLFSYSEKSWSEWWGIHCASPGLTASQRSSVTSWTSRPEVSIKGPVSPNFLYKFLLFSSFFHDVIDVNYCEIMFKMLLFCRLLKYNLSDS